MKTVTVVGRRVRVLYSNTVKQCKQGEGVTNTGVATLAAIDGWIPRNLTAPHNTLAGFVFKCTLLVLLTELPIKL